MGRAPNPFTNPVVITTIAAAAARRAGRSAIKLIKETSNGYPDGIHQL